MSIDRKVFFDQIRASLFGGSLSTSQVDGIGKILDEWDKRGLTDLRWLANMLAQVKVETGNLFQPIREGGGEKYLKSKPYYPWVGEGLIQVTWEENHRKFGATAPGQLLTWPVALKALFDGMINGMFTTRKLSDYFSATKDDAYEARRIVNKLDRAKEIAGYHRAFLAALQPATSLQKVQTTPAGSDRAAGVAQQDFAITPVSGAQLPGEAPTVDELDEGDRYKLQTKLQAKGFWTAGMADGKPGQKTDDALLAFKRLNNLPANTMVDDATWTALDDGKSAPVSADRAALTEKTAAAATGNPIFAKIRSVKNWLLYGGGGTTAAVVSNQSGGVDVARKATGLEDTGQAVIAHASFMDTLLSTVKSAASTGLDVFQWFAAHPFLLYGGVGIGVGWGVWTLAAHMIEQLRIGRITT